MREEIKRIMDHAGMLWVPGGVYELRIPKTKRQTVSGYYDDLERFATDAAKWDGKAPGVYATLNPVNPALLARSANHFQEWAEHTTSDSDVERRHWLPLDFDPKRPAGISSTDAEHVQAIQRARDAANWLVQLGFSPADLILADSGNGAHLLAQIELEVSDTSLRLMRRCIEAISLHFGDDRVGVDIGNANAARIWKVYGTRACKGENLPARPHRLARILQAPGRDV